MDIDKGNIKILNLCSSTMGGAGTATVLFHEYLLDNGFCSVIVARETDVNGDSNIIRYRPREKGFAYFRYKKRKKLYRALSKRWSKIYNDNLPTLRITFDDQRTTASADTILKQTGFKPDIIFVHWTHTFITPEIIADLKRLTNAHIVSLMMDNASFTGGCHYPYDCKGYAGDCGQCPLFTTVHDISSGILSRKLSFFPSDMEFWGVSADCRRVAESALGRQRKAFPILFPIDERILPGESKEQIRKELSIGDSEIVVMLGCTSFDVIDKRKGLEYLIAILARIKAKAPQLQQRISLIAVGNHSSNIIEHLGYRTLRPGFVPLERLMRLFKASDLFLSTSIEDSGPLMINQSVAVGTPVAAFNIGVAQDLIEDNVTGVKAPLFAYECLADKIISFLDQPRTAFDERTQLCLKHFAEKSNVLSPIRQIMRLAQM